MVGDLQDARRRRDQPWSDRAFHFPADVACQQQGDVAIDDLQDDRVVIADAAAFPVGLRRVQHAETNLAEAESVAGPASSDRYVKARRGIEDIGRGPMRRDRHTHPQSAGGEVGEHA